MEKQNFLELRQTIENLVSGFQLKQAREQIKNLDVDAIPKKMRADFASLARRAGLNKLAVKILHHNIFGTSHPDPKDLVEYSSGLRKMGLINQAIALLNRCDLPESYLHRAFCHISCWDYQCAYEDLTLFVNTKNIEPGKKLVGDLNLVSCLTELGELQEAHRLLDSVESQAKEKSQHLYLNCLEYRGQIYIQEGETKKAQAVLGLASQLSQTEEGTTSLFIEKWHLISRCHELNLSSNSTEIQAFRAIIRRHGHWETLRDFDWQIARITKDQKAIEHVFYGTPYPSFRNYISKSFSQKDWSKPWAWKDRNLPTSTESTMDLFDLKSVPLPYGMGLHRLCLLLASDLYRPWSVERLFNVLFTTEHFNPFSSHKKVYRLLEKLIAAIGKSEMPLEVQSTVQGYRLRLKPRASLLIYPQMQFDSQEVMLKYRLHYLGLDSFTVKQAMDKIPLSQHQWYRAINKMEAAGLIVSDVGEKPHFLIKRAS